MSKLARITSIDQLHNAFDATAEQPLLLFKHSTRCPISKAAYRELESYLNDAPNEKITYGLIYVVEDREVSNKAEDKLGVRHESPQAILIKDGQAVWHMSHSRITAETIKGNLK